MPFTRIYEALSIQPGDTNALDTLIEQYPYFETPYILKAVAEKNNERALHNAALLCNNPAWLHALLQDDATIAVPAETVSATVEQEEAAATIIEAAPGTPVEDQYQPVTITETAPAEPVSIPVEQEKTAATVIEAVPGAPVETGLQPETVPEIVPVAASAAAAAMTGTEAGTPVEAQPEPVTENMVEAGQPAEPLETAVVAETPEKTAEPVEEQPAFEPYHTVDYFASQGIKLSKEAVPTDRFSHQLKSFTEWLKTMKRLPSGEMDTTVKPAQQEAVVQMAETSLKKTEVITETMAEVLVKQGRVQEAIEILQKLSLQDKAKSAYFAARIEHLKTI